MPSDASISSDGVLVLLSTICAEAESLSIGYQRASNPGRIESYIRDDCDGLVVCTPSPHGKPPNDSYIIAA